MHREPPRLVGYVFLVALLTFHVARNLVQLSGECQVLETMVSYKEHTKSKSIKESSITLTVFIRSSSVITSGGVNRILTFDSLDNNENDKKILHPHVYMGWLG